MGDQGVLTNVDDLEKIESTESESADANDDQLEASNEKATGFRCVFTLNSSLRPKIGKMATKVSSNSDRATGGVDDAPLSEAKFLQVSVLPVCIRCFT